MRAPQETEFGSTTHVATSDLRVQVHAMGEPLKFITGNDGTCGTQESCTSSCSTPANVHGETISDPVLQYNFPDDEDTSSTMHGPFSPDPAPVDEDSSKGVKRQRSSSSSSAEGSASRPGIDDDDDETDVCRKVRARPFARCSLTRS